MDQKEMARLGGLARAERLSAKRRKEIATKAALVSAVKRSKKAREKKRDAVGKNG